MVHAVAEQVRQKHIDLFKLLQRLLLAANSKDEQLNLNPKP